MIPRLGRAGPPDQLVVDRGAKFTSEVFCASVKCMGWCVIVGRHGYRYTSTLLRCRIGRRQGEWANGVMSDTLCAYANGRKDEWDRHLTLVDFAINKPHRRLATT